MASVDSCTLNCSGDGSRSGWPLPACGGRAGSELKTGARLEAALIVSSNCMNAKSTIHCVGNLLLIASLYATLNLTQFALGVPAVSGESSIRVTRFQVPAQVRPGELRRLTCQYELQGASLHAMKMFKDDKEFYRYTANPATPEDKKLIFPVAGVHVELGKSNDKEVSMRTSKRSTGQYKCQVSVEGTFVSVSAERRMEVIDPSSLSASGLSGGVDHLAGASVWQQHLMGQQQQRQHYNSNGIRPSASAHNALAPNSRAVQQNPSQVYSPASAGASRTTRPTLGSMVSMEPLAGLVALTIGALLLELLREPRLWLLASG